jgi:ribosome-associated protein
MPESEKSQSDPLSKTQRKKDMLALQELGKKLIALPASQLAKIPLPDILIEAIRLSHTLKSNEAKRRHLQYIGKVMREIDPEPIEVALKQIQFKNEQRTSQFHLVEQWRDKLISGDDTILQSFLEAYPKTDRQKLRQLVRKAKHDHVKQKNTGGETGLFRYLRELL